jgi:hypothetical protein
MADFKRILEGFFRRRGIYGDDRKSLLEAFRNAGTKLTGTLNKAVSGIAGNGGNLAEWDSDGNLVDSGHKFKANEHIDHSNVSIQPGDGLGGGGDLTFNRPINLRIESAPDLSSPESADELILSDTSAVGQFNPYAPKKADVGSVLDIYNSRTATLTNKTIDGNNNSLTVLQSSVQPEVETISLTSGGTVVLTPTKRFVDLQLGATDISSIDTTNLPDGAVLFIRMLFVSGSAFQLGSGIKFKDEDYYSQFNNFRWIPNSGDIYVFVSSGNNSIKEIARFPNNNSQLDNTIINTVSSNYQTQAEDLLKVSSSGTTITVSDYDINQGNAIKIKDTSGSAGSSAITINTQSSQNIDGGSSISINTNYGSAIVQSDGSNVFSF